VGGTLTRIKRRGSGPGADGWKGRATRQPGLGGRVPGGLVTGGGTVRRPGAGSGLSQSCRMPLTVAPRGHAPLRANGAAAGAAVVRAISCNNLPAMAPSEIRSRPIAERVATLPHPATAGLAGEA
jgi:hypothetical protein